MVRYLVSRPKAVLVSFFALLILGISAYYQLSTSLLPQLDIPEIHVNVVLENFGAREIEKRVISVLRNRFSQLNGLSSIESSSNEGEGSIKLVFEHGVNLSLAFIEVNEKLDVVMTNFPSGMKRPFVSKGAISDIPMFHLNIYPKDKDVQENRMAELSSFSKEVIKRRLEQLSEVSTVDVSGLSELQVEIVPKRGYLQSLGISDDHLISSVQNSKLELGNLLVRDGHFMYYLNFSSEMSDLEAIRGISLKIKDKLFHLRDLADIQITNSERKGSFFNKTYRAIDMAIRKKSHARVSDFENSFYSLLRQFEIDYPELEFKVTNDQTQLLNYSIANLKQDIIIGGVLSFLLMLVFVRNLRPALLIGVTIPTTLIMSMAGFYLLKINLNIISLGGLILGLGMIIDNSIVVIDNIGRYRKDNLFSVKEAAIRGTNEVMKPLIASVVTNCVVFIPLISLSGLAGAIFYDQAISITIGVVTSLIVSIFLLPPLYVVVNSICPGREITFKARVSITKCYERGLALTFQYKVYVVLIVMILSGASMIFFHLLKKERLPPLTRKDFEMNINWNENISLDESERRVQFIANSMLDEVEQMSSWVGNQQFLFLHDMNIGYSGAKMHIKANNTIKVNDLRDKVGDLFRKLYPVAKVKFSNGKNPLDAVFAEELAVLRMELTSSEDRITPSIYTAETLLDTLSKIFPEIHLQPIEKHKQIVLNIKPEKASIYNVDIKALTKKISSVLKPTFIDFFQGEQELVPIILNANESTSIHELLKQSFVSNQAETPVRLASLVDLHFAQDYQTIYAGKSGEYLPIDFNSNSPKQDIKVLQQFMENQNTISANYSGSYFANKLLMREMAVVFLVSFLLLFFVLSAQFESLTQPLLVLIELPVALSGALLFLFLGGNSINLMSMIGLIVMSGLIINDSILKIDAINRLRQEGLPLKTAIYEGGHRRLKPIVMITLTNIGALLPSLFMADWGSELQKPLVLALVGGMLVGMVVSLFFLPLMYWAIYKNDHFKKKIT